MVRAVLAGQEELLERVGEEVDLLGEETREVILLDGVVGLDVEHLLRRFLRGEKCGRKVDDLEPPVGRLATEAN